MTHLKIVHLILKYWSHGSYISLFFVHYVTRIIRPAHRAPKIGKCNFIGIGWKKGENCTCIRAAGRYGDLGNGPQQMLADIYNHPDSRRGVGEVLPTTYACLYQDLCHSGGPACMCGTLLLCHYLLLSVIHYVVVDGFLGPLHIL